MGAAQLQRLLADKNLAPSAPGQHEVQRIPLPTPARDIPSSTPPKDIKSNNLLPDTARLGAQPLPVISARAPLTAATVFQAPWQGTDMAMHGSGAVSRAVYPSSPEPSLPAHTGIEAGVEGESRPASIFSGYDRQPNRTIPAFDALYDQLLERLNREFRSAYGSGGG
jgi:hypothetical protein